ncbi:MAG: 50S ribosomal protein L1, partial [Candidatus Poseidoniia archaeon]
MKQAIADVLETRKERKFTETVEVAINLRDVDLQNPQKRINDELALPHGRGRPAKVGVFARKELAEKAKAHADLMITPEELGDLADNKRRARKVVDGIDYFVAEISMMADIGKSLGVVLGPRGKMPRPVPPTADIARIIDGLHNLVILR